MTAHDIVELLNEILVTDQKAMHKLCETRLRVTGKITDRVTVLEPTLGQYFLGPLGVLNGICRIDGETLEAVYGDGPDGRLMYFRLRDKGDGDAGGQPGVQGGHGPEF